MQSKHFYRGDKNVNKTILDQELNLSAMLRSFKISHNEKLVHKE